VLRDTTSRGLYVRVWPPHTSERRGGGGGAIKVYSIPGIFGDTSELVIKKENPMRNRID